MAEDIEKVLKAAASSVSCETGEVSKETLQSIREQLLGISSKSDQSFIYELYKRIVDEEKNGKKSIKK